MVHSFCKYPFIQASHILFKVFNGYTFKWGWYESGGSKLLCSNGLLDRSRWYRLCSTDSKQPGYTAEVVIWSCINRKGWKTLKKNIKSKENSSSEDDTSVICFDSYLESKENEDWIQCSVCKNWFHLDWVNCSPSGRFNCLNCDSDDSD